MLSILVRMLYSRAGSYPSGQPELHGEAFSTNSPEGTCPNCHGIGRIYDATEQTMVPDSSLTIRERAIAASPSAWGGQNQRDILVTLGYDLDRPWDKLPKKDRDWICSPKNSQSDPSSSSPPIPLQCFVLGSHRGSRTLRPGELT
jgi:excinuclease ABC subunit A